MPASTPMPKNVVATVKKIIGPTHIVLGRIYQMVCNRSTDNEHLLRPSSNDARCLYVLSHSYYHRSTLV